MNPRKTNIYLAIIASKLPANGKIILLHMLFHSSDIGRNGPCIARSEATHEKLAKACQMSVPTVQRQMKKLLTGSLVSRGEHYQITVKPKK